MKERVGERKIKIKENRQGEEEEEDGERERHQFIDLGQTSAHIEQDIQQVNHAYQCKGNVRLKNNQTDRILHAFKERFNGTYTTK